MGERRCSVSYRAALPIAVAVACATDTSGLARREPRAGESAGAGGAGTTAPDSGSGNATSWEGGGAGNPGDGGGLGAVAIVHGIVDGGRLYVCLWETTSSRTLRTERPIPGGGLAYGEVHRLPTDWDLSSQEIAAELFMAAPAALDELGCEELSTSAVNLTPPPAPDAGSDLGDAGARGPGPFPVDPVVPRRAGSVTFPPRALRAGAAYALVSAGCATPGRSLAEEVCGARDSLFGGYQALVLAEFGRGASAGAEGPLGLQFLNASRAVPRADLVLQGTTERQSVTLANDVRFGALRPTEPARVAAPVGLELHVDGAAVSTYTQAWADTLTSVEAAVMDVEREHLVVYVGPAPTVSADRGFAPPRFVSIASAE